AGEHQRGACAGPFRTELARERPACADAVLDHKGLAKRRGEALGHDARLIASVTAGDEGHHDLDRPLRPRLPQYRATEKNRDEKRQPASHPLRITLSRASARRLSAKSSTC